MKVAFYHGNQFAFETTFKDKEDFKNHLRYLINDNSCNSIKLKSCITRETNFGNSGYNTGKPHDCKITLTVNLCNLSIGKNQYWFKNVVDLNSCEFFQQNVGKLVEFNYEGKTRFLKVRKECDMHLEGNDAVKDNDDSYRKFIKNKISNLKILAELEC